MSRTATLPGTAQFNGRTFYRMMTRYRLDCQTLSYRHMNRNLRQVLVFQVPAIVLDVNFTYGVVDPIAVLQIENNLAAVVFEHIDRVWVC